MDIDDWRTTHDRHMASSPVRATLLNILDRAEFPDARHMVFRLKFPYAPIRAVIWERQITYPIMPKELNANPGLAETASIGTGFKILDNRQPSVTVEFRKNAEYWGGDPFIERWHAPTIPEYANRYAQFVNGNIMDFSTTARDVLLMTKDAPNTVIVAAEIPSDSVTRMRFGHLTAQERAWKDPRVRVAIRQSIDFKKIGEFLSNKADLEAAGIPIEVSPMTHLNKDPTFWLNPEAGELGALSVNYLYDPAEAKKGTSAAGFSDPIELNFIVRQMEGVIPEENQLVMDSLAVSGAFRLKPQYTRSATEHNDLVFTGGFDGLAIQSGIGSTEADRIIYRDYHSEGNLPRGPQAFPDPRLDAIAAAQRQEVNVEKRLQLLKDFQYLAAELMPTIPGRHDYTTLGFRWPWLHNLHYGPSGSPPGGWPEQGGHLQWLSPDMPNRERGAS
jgi:ABC-type transport system substrate-binding protein